MPLCLKMGCKLSAAHDDFPPVEHQLRTKWDEFWGCLLPQYGLTQTWNELGKVHYRLVLFANETIHVIDA